MRPTSDKVRAALFSSLADTVDGANFLDLFAGTGAVGIEAYSRGARHITFVEKHTSALLRNLSLLPKSAYLCVCSDVFKSNLTGVLFDIIYIDPPYGSYNPEYVLKWVKKRGLLAKNGAIAYEDSVRAKVNWEQMPFPLSKKRRYGDTIILYFVGEI